MQSLVFYQSLWAMQLRRPGTPERTLEESFAMVAEAGFTGMGMDLGEADIELAYEAKPLFERHQLGCLFNAFPTSTQSLRKMLGIAKEFGCPFMNVIGQVMPATVAGMISVTREWIDISAEEGVPILFETHRNGLYNDLFATLELLEAVDELRLCADLSHFLIDREFPFPLRTEHLELISRILNRSDSLQGRVASNEQIQLQLSFPQHRKWLDLFLGWWEEGIISWRARSAEDAKLIFLCELGPPEYAMTDHEGFELSDRWEEALMLRELVSDVWRRAGEMRRESNKGDQLDATVAAQTG